MEHLFDFISSSPTAFHASAHIASLLDENGFRRLEEGTSWQLDGGKGYYVVRNSSSLIAFRMPGTALPPESVMIAAAHLDSPAFKIKENAVLSGPGAYGRTVPREILVKLMADPEQKKDFLDFCYQFDSNLYVCGMGKDNLLAVGDV